MSLDELVRRAQGGDHDAFCALAGLVVGRMRGTARLILRDVGLADDAVQDALVAAWQHLPQLRDPARLDAWLHRLLVRACHRSARRDRRRNLIEIPLLADHDPSAADSSSSFAVRDELARAFGQLTPEHRTVLSLVFFADLKMEDVATALGVPLSTARSRCYRAMEALRSVLAADERRPVMLQEGTR
jgi:RNA polymerase sigma-70 factor (ECF subfamily)